MLYPHIDLTQRLVEARYRRNALKNHGCSTYVLSIAGDAIICLCCGSGSTYAAYVEQRFCDFCDESHSEAIGV